MSEGDKTLLKMGIRAGCLAVYILIALSAGFILPHAGAEERIRIVNDPTGFSMLEAEENGMFNIGPAIGGVDTEAEASLKKDVLKFDYTIFPGAIAGLWTKTYPAKFRAGLVDAVIAGVKMKNPAQLDEVTVKLEIKGDRGVQSAPVHMESTGWSYVREPVDWERIGKLTEVVFVVSPKDSKKRLDGILYFDLNFYKLTPLQKYAVAVKAGLVLLAGLILALMAAIAGTLFGKPPSRKESPGLSGISRDILYGAAAVMTLGVAMKIYYLGMVNPLNAGFSYAFLGVGLMGMVIAEVLKFGLTGRHLTVAEVFQNILISGLLGASSSRFELLQSPASWVQFLMLSNLISALAFVIYHFANARSLASSGRHLKAISAALIAGTPYLFNWLLLLGSAGMLRIIGNGITFGLIAAPAVSELIGRLLVMFVFNEIVTNSIAMATKGRIIKAPRAHLTMLLVSLGVIIAPVIANFGSGALVAKLHIALRAFVSILTTALSYGGLWGEVYLITGSLLDAGKRIAPSAETILKHVKAGIKKGMAYSAILIGMLYALGMILNAPLSQKFMALAPIIIGIFSGAALFPLIKTIIESFDGSLRFFERVKYSYQDLTLCARGAVAGFGFACMATHNLFARNMPDRIIFGLLIGLLASGGVSVIRDALYALKGRGKIQSWRLYFVDSLLGVFVGSAAAFYMDSLQVPVVVEKFRLYLSSGLPPADYITYPLVNKWGRIDLGSYTGGVKLLFTESLAGVINWSIAAWLFAINKVFLQAFFEKDKAPIKFFFSKAGFAQLIEHMIYVLRWGLWMSPIIFTFLRMMPEPTWYNQDGAVRTLFAIFNNITMAPEAFKAWSLQVFVWVLALDWFRILIWMDHMGLRVATLVNLSFIGMDRLDEKIGRFIGPASAQRYIPEGVKRFATWAPLLIPFYLPRGKGWDYAWNTSVAMQNAAEGKGILFAIQRLALPQMLILICSGLLVCTGISFGVRALSRRSRKRRIASYELGNREYKVVLKGNGDIYSEVTGPESDVSRRSYDTIDPCGRILYIVDASEAPAGNSRAWPVVGNFPAGKFEPSRIEKCGDALKVVNISNDVKTTIDISLPDQDSTAEIWKVTVENMADRPRRLKIVPYLEWILNGGIHDRFHTQYARLYPEMEYAVGVNAILSWQKATRSMGILASEIPTEGFTTSRADFIGRARSIWSPRIMDSLDFMDSRDTSGYPTFDPIGSFIVDAAVGPKASVTMRLMIGYAGSRDKALELIKKHLNPQGGDARGLTPEKKKRVLLIGHGEIPPGTPQPYSTYAGNGNSLVVHTPYTPRPIDHAMSNAIHSVMVTNRGLHTSCNGNSQQNRLTPDWADTVTREIPSEAIYLFDQDRNEWYSPTYHPLNDKSAKYESEFSVDGSAIFRMSKGTVSTELTVFVPSDEPTGVYLLTVKNNAGHSRRIKISPYFQMVMGFMPEKSGPLGGRYDKALNALFYENPRNIFRSGTAFVSMSIPSERFETRRGRYFGFGRGVDHPFMVENGKPDTTQLTDDAQIAGLLGTIEIPARGEQTVAIILGQADDKKACAAIIRKYKDIEKAKKSLEDTRKWWLSLMATLKVETNSLEFDRYQNWLKYQALAERIWARRGFYQTSGAYGFRDQLQDTVNLIWIDPALARRQIILHASQQFIQGDVFHWFFTLTDGRTAFSCRSHASDNPVWLAWGVAEYIRATGDHSILDEMTSYVESEFPFAKLPKNKQGWGHLYHRTTRSDTVYRHCMRSIDLILDDRTGKNGLPLIQTGDWNDGLDEIGSEGKGESVWLGFFLYYILNGMADIIETKDGPARKRHYIKKMEALKNALEKTWREDRYLRAIHDDGTEIGLKGSGIWEIDALTASWAVISGINFERGLTIFNTALKMLEKDNAILLGWPALREDTKPYLGRSSKYPEGVRENGMYCHGVQWLVRAARILAEQFERQGNRAKADEYAATAYRLWLKISPITHMSPGEIEIYGGQPNKQAADLLTNFEPGRMIWHGYTGAAGWMLRQAMEGVVGASLAKNEMILPKDLDRPRGGLKIKSVRRDVGKSPFGVTV